MSVVVVQILLMLLLIEVCSAYRRGRTGRGGVLEVCSEMSVLSDWLRIEIVVVVIAACDDPPEW